MSATLCLINSRVESSRPPVYYAAARRGARGAVLRAAAFFSAGLHDDSVQATAAAADRRALIQRRAARLPARRARRLGPYNCTTDCLPGLATAARSRRRSLRHFHCG